MRMHVFPHMDTFFSCVLVSFMRPRFLCTHYKCCRAPWLDVYICARGYVAYNKRQTLYSVENTRFFIMSKSIV
jgi:hypothetical protein